MLSLQKWVTHVMPYFHLSSRVNQWKTTTCQDDVSMMIFSLVNFGFLVETNQWLLCVIKIILAVVDQQSRFKLRVPSSESYFQPRTQWLWWAPRWTTHSFSHASCKKNQETIKYSHTPTFKSTIKIARYTSKSLGLKSLRSMPKIAIWDLYDNYWV